MHQQQIRDTVVARLRRRRWLRAVAAIDSLNAEGIWGRLK